MKKLQMKLLYALLASLFLHFNLLSMNHRKLTEDEIQLYDDVASLKAGFQKEMKDTARRYRKTKNETLRNKYEQLIYRQAEQVVNCKQTARYNNRLKKDYNKRYGNKYTIKEKRKKQKPRRNRRVPQNTKQQKKNSIVSYILSPFGYGNKKSGKKQNKKILTKKKGAFDLIERKTKKDTLKRKSYVRQFILYILSFCKYRRNYEQTIYAESN